MIPIVLLAECCHFADILPHLAIARQAKLGAGQYSVILYIVGTWPPCNRNPVQFPEATMPGGHTTPAVSYSLMLLATNQIAFSGSANTVTMIQVLRVVTITFSTILLLLLTKCIDIATDVDVTGHEILEKNPRSSCRSSTIAWDLLVLPILPHLAIAGFAGLPAESTQNSFALYTNWSAV